MTVKFTFCTFACLLMQFSVCCGEWSMFKQRKVYTVVLLPAHFSGFSIARQKRSRTEALFVKWAAQCKRIRSSENELGLP